MAEDLRLLTEAEQLLANLLKQGEASPLDIESSLSIADPDTPFLQTSPKDRIPGSTQVYGKHDIPTVQKLNRLNAAGLIEAQEGIDAETRFARRAAIREMKATIKPVRTVFKHLGTPGLLLAALLAENEFEFVGDLTSSGDVGAGSDIILDAATGKPITPKEKAAQEKSKLEGFGEEGSIQGFLGTPEQELARAIKIQVKQYETADVGIDVTQATLGNFHKAISLMGSETDVNKKLAAALAVQAIGSQLILQRMGDYTTQATASLGIADLEAQIQSGMQADIKSPYNPHDGSHSRETQILIDKKTNLLANIPNLAKQYATLDPLYAAPMAAAEAILKSLPITERLSMAQERMMEKNAAAGTIEDSAAKNYAFMQNRYAQIDWNDPLQVMKIKHEFLYDKNFADMYKDQKLSINDARTARTLYAFSDQPVDKQRAFSIMNRIEADSLGVADKGITETERLSRLSKVSENMKLIKLVYSSPLAPKEQKKINDKMSIFVGSAKEKDMERRMEEANVRETMLQEFAIKQFSSDVTQWKGMDLTDPLVQLSISSVRKQTGKQGVPIEAFAAEFLRQPSELTFARRLTKLKAYIHSSAAGTKDNSSVMPEISGDILYNNIAPGAFRVWFNSILGQ